PFTDMAVALGYAVATRGADHLRGTMPCISSEDRRLKEIFGDPETLQKYMDNPRSIEKKGVFTALNEDGMAMVNALNICCFVVGDTRRKRLVVEDLAELMSTCTGVDINGDDLMKVGERITNIEKAFNVREGMRRKDDTLPRSFFVEEETEWGTTGISEDNFQKMLDEYYDFRGWDKEGIPTRKKLEELGLSYVAGQIGAE
ncbi:MAG: aldehyde ferredoxin oxidoreductase C-terminal domain-containing protein, partial [Dehalococcoidia bacterium]|nr:aldehyde ferredoxin oxidoreductase C-terminal domain-containing protein [Dehalococcoidia bacterium]